jgi:hypothetical protein
MAEKKFSELTAKGATIADTDIVAISESAGGGTYTSKSVTGANIKALVTDANMTTTDITTNDVSTSKHGFVPKAPNDTSVSLIGDGSFGKPTPNVQSITSSATVTATSANDLVKITAQAAGLTLANPTGTFAEGQALIYRIKDNGTARSITFGAKFRALGVTLPTTTTISKTTYVGCIYNSTDDKFDVVASLTEA